MRRVPKQFRQFIKQEAANDDVAQAEQAALAEQAEQAPADIRSIFSDVRSFFDTRFQTYAVRLDGKEADAETTEAEDTLEADGEFEEELRGVQEVGKALENVYGELETHQRIGKNTDEKIALYHTALLQEVRDGYAGLCQEIEHGFSLPDEAERIGPEEARVFFMKWCRETVARLKKICKALIAERMSLVSSEEKDESARREEEEMMYDDDEERHEEEEVATPSARAAAAAQAGTAVQTEEEVVPEATEDDEEQAEGVHVIRSTNPKRQDQWKKMINHGFINGFIEQDDAGGFLLRVTRQVLPWCSAGEKDFFLKNQQWQDMFPGFFQTVKNPAGGGYYPEAIFLDTTGKALRYYLNDRWDDYTGTEEYAAFERSGTGLYRKLEDDVDDAA